MNIVIENAFEISLSMRVIGTGLGLWLVWKSAMAFQHHRDSRTFWDFAAATTLLSALILLLNSGLGALEWQDSGGLRDVFRMMAIILTTSTLLGVATLVLSYENAKQNR